MKFPKDILMIDFEGVSNPIQIGCILLDKETLEEKDSFVSYIEADMRGKTSTKSGISQENLIGAPTQAEVGRMVFEKFGTNVIVSAFVADLDNRHFKKIMTAAGVDSMAYDYHILDIWPIAYLNLLKKGNTEAFRSEEIFQAFGATPRGIHNALEDCRITADVLRKLCFDTK